MKTILLSMLLSVFMLTGCKKESVDTINSEKVTNTIIKISSVTPNSDPLYDPEIVVDGRLYQPLMSVTGDVLVSFEGTTFTNYDPDPYLSVSIKRKDGRIVELSFPLQRDSLYTIDFKYRFYTTVKVHCE